MTQGSMAQVQKQYQQHPTEANDGLKTHMVWPPTLASFLCLKPGLKRDISEKMYA